MSGVYIALVHHPVRDRTGAIVTTAVTNLDVHDIARSARTFGLAGYFVVTPISAQRALVERILDHWHHGEGKERVPSRGVALDLCKPVHDIESACAVIEAREGARPTMVATAAAPPATIPVRSFAEEGDRMKAATRPTLLLFGTGHGLAPSVLADADAILAPIRGGHYNHLSVRGAVAIILDRLFGETGAPSPPTRP